jgi:hypothetical protein
MSFKYNKTFYIIFIISFVIFCTGFIYVDLNSKSFIFISTLTGGIVSACILYIVVEIIPANKKKKDTLEVLNKTICSILEAFFKPSMFQNEKSIKYVSLDYINSIDKIKEAQNDIKIFNIDFLQLKFPIETAHSRYNDFQNLLILVNNISPNHSLLWLDLIEKIRLMSEEFNYFIENPNMELLKNLKQLNKYEDRNDKTYLMCSSLQIRILEFFESVENWINENN